MAPTRRGVRLLLLAVALWAFALMPVAAAKARPAHAQVAPYNAALGVFAETNPYFLAVLGVMVAAGYVCTQVSDCEAMVSSVWAGLPAWFGNGVVSDVGAGKLYTDVTAYTSYDPVALNAAVKGAEALGYHRVTMSGAETMGTTSGSGTAVTETNPVLWVGPQFTGTPTIGQVIATVVAPFTLANTSTPGTGGTAANVAGVEYWYSVTRGTDAMSVHPDAIVSCHNWNGAGDSTVHVTTGGPFPRYDMTTGQGDVNTYTTAGQGCEITFRIVASTASNGGGWFALPNIYVQYLNSNAKWSATTLAVPYTVWTAVVGGTSQWHPDGPSVNPGKVAIPATAAAIAGTNVTTNPNATTTLKDGTTVPVVNPALAAPTDTGFLSSAIGVLTSIRDYVTDIPNVVAKLVALPGAMVDALTGALVPTASLTTVLATPKTTLLNAVPACIVDDSASALTGLLAGATSSTTTIHLATIGGQSVDLVFQDSTAVQLARLTTKVGALALLVLYGFALFRRFFERSG